MPPRPLVHSVRSAFAFGVVAAILLSNSARAQTAESTSPSGREAGEPSVLTGLWTRSNLLGDMGGLRSALGRYGVTLNLQETSEVFGNVSGGIRQGAAYDGLTQMSLAIDTAKAFGWEGGAFNISALQIHGRNLSAEKLGNLQTVSGIEANRATRLWELWYQQAFFDGRADIKVGQQSIDQEFIVSQYSGLFINTMMGWPMLPSADLYAGGPAYPLSSLGVRFRAQPTGALTVLAGVFDDNPPGGPFSNDSQLRGAEAAGVKFNLGTGALFIAEMQYAVSQPALGELDTGTGAAGLPGTYKLGAWFDTAAFPDQRFDDTGLSLADPGSSGNALMRRHSFSIYGVVDQMIWRPDAQEQRAVAFFARVMGAPGDRNPIDFSINTGLSLRSPLPGRDNDSFGIGYGLAKVSGRASDRDRDTAFFSQSFTPTRSSEHFIEVTYQYQVAPWWQLQPDFQYVFNPGGGVVNPSNPNQRIGDEAVFGLRTNITF
jgi:porin